LKSFTWHQSIPAHHLSGWHSWRIILIAYKRLLGRFAASHPLPLGVTVKADIETYIGLGITENLEG
jgi:hypothetical protein